MAAIMARDSSRRFNEGEGHEYELVSTFDAPAAPAVGEGAKGSDALDNRTGDSTR